MSEEIQGITAQVYKKTDSRKYRLSVYTLVISTVLLAFGKLDASSYKYLVAATVAAYIAGNVAQKWVGGQDVSK